MSDAAAAKIVRQGLASPVTALALVGAIVAATGTATTFYVSINRDLDQLSQKVVRLEQRDAESAKAMGDLRQDIAAMKISIAGIEASLRFLVDQQRRRPAD